MAQVVVSNCSAGTAVALASAWSTRGTSTRTCPNSCQQAWGSPSGRRRATGQGLRILRTGGWGSHALARIGSPWLPASAWLPAGGHQRTYLLYSVHVYVCSPTQLRLHGIGDARCVGNPQRVAFPDARCLLPTGHRRSRNQGSRREVLSACRTPEKEEAWAEQGAVPVTHCIASHRITRRYMNVFPGLIRIRPFCTVPCMPYYPLKLETVCSTTYFALQRRHPPLNRCHFRPSQFTPTTYIYQVRATRLLSSTSIILQSPPSRASTPW